MAGSVVAAGRSQTTRHAASGGRLFLACAGQEREEVDRLAIECGLGTAEQVPLAGVVAQLEDRLEMIGRLDALSDDAVAARACERSERLQDRLGRPVRRAGTDEREVDLEDVELDLAQKPKTGIPRADIVDGDAHLVAAKGRDRLLETTQVIDALALGDLHDELGRRDAVAASQGEDLL